VTGTNFRYKERPTAWLSCFVVEILDYRHEVSLWLARFAVELLARKGRSPLEKRCPDAAGRSRRRRLTSSATGA
jgi:hypothetical protein